MSLALCDAAPRRAYQRADPCWSCAHVTPAAFAALQAERGSGPARCSMRAQCEGLDTRPKKGSVVRRIRATLHQQSVAAQCSTRAATEPFTPESARRNIRRVCPCSAKKPCITWLSSSIDRYDLRTVKHCASRIYCSKPALHGSKVHCVQASRVLTQVPLNAARFLAMLGLKWGNALPFS